MRVSGPSAIDQHHDLSKQVRIKHPICLPGAHQTHCRPSPTPATLQSTKCCACHAKASGRAAETKGRRGVHPTPCRAPSAPPAMQKAAETKGRQGVHPTPLQSTECRACHAKLTGKAAETKGRQGVHPIPCRAPSAAPATQKLPAEQRRPRDARAYIRPLAEHQVLRLPRKSYRQSGGDQGTPGRTSDPLQRTKCRACHAKPTSKAAESKGRQGVHPTPCRAPVLRLPRKIPAERRRPKEARAYIRPQAGRAAETKGRQGVHPTPLQSTECRACHAKLTGKAAETKGRQGVHPIPCRAPSATPATQKLPAEQRRPRDARAYIRPLAEHQVLRLARKSYRQSGGDQGTPGRTSDPLQSTKCRACHAKK